jgi:hypothetical protein
MEYKVLQHKINIKFLVKLEKNDPVISRMLQQFYAGAVMSGTWVFGWIKQFQDGEVSKDPTI